MRLLLLALLAAPLRAAGPAAAVDELDGQWLRVYEACGKPLAEVPDFSASGGDAQIGRRMILSLDGRSFSAHAMKSLRCGAAPAERRRPDDSWLVDCEAGSENSGTLERDGEWIHLHAAHEDFGNNWGASMADFRYRFIGPVLELSRESYTANCKDEPLYMYWVRVPNT